MQPDTMKYLAGMLRGSIERLLGKIETGADSNGQMLTELGEQTVRLHDLTHHASAHPSPQGPTRGDELLAGVQTRISDLDGLRDHLVQNGFSTKDPRYKALVEIIVFVAACSSATL